MKFKHIAAVLAGAAALAAPSCSLDEKFYSEVTPDTFFTSPESTYAVLVPSLYPLEVVYGADRWYLQELTTDEMVCPKRGADMVQRRRVLSPALSYLGVARTTVSS